MEKENNINDRNISLDVIRCVACFGVISVHFFLNNGFLGEAILGKRMILMLLLRQLFMFCVPLFLILSGYLLSNRRFEVRFYKKLGKTYSIYVLASIFCIYMTPLLYRTICWVFNMEAPVWVPITLKSIIKGILDFTAAPYSWYIEMYIGLFLIIPFLNMVYNNLTSKREKLLLIIIVFILSSLPSITNSYNFDSFEWWKNPNVLTPEGVRYPYYKIVPDYWQSLYPILYYFIGCFIKEYGIKLKKSLNVVFLVLTIIIWGAYCIWRNRGGVTFVAGGWSEWSSAFDVVYSFLIFVLLLNTDYTGVPKIVKKLVVKISKLSLAAYLVSRVFDNSFYAVLNIKVSDVKLRLAYYFIIVPAVFLCSVVSADIVYKVYELLVKALEIIKNNYIKRNTTN